jgi:hypothetical protein
METINNHRIDHYFVTYSFLRSLLGTAVENMQVECMVHPFYLVFSFCGGAVVFYVMMVSGHIFKVLLDKWVE